MVMSMVVKELGKTIQGQQESRDELIRNSKFLRAAGAFWRGHWWSYKH